MSRNTTTTLTGSTMSWSLYLSNINTTSISVTDSQISLLHAYETACKRGSDARFHLLSDSIGCIIDALICTAGAINSRSQMLRSVNLLQTVLCDVNDKLLQLAIRQLTTCHLARFESSQSTTTNRNPVPSPPSSPRMSRARAPSFLRPLVNIAIDRVSDTQLSGAAADSLSILLSCPSLDLGADDQIPPPVCRDAEHHTRRLIAMLITEIVLTASPNALSSLAKLLRRENARQIFCEKDGVSTLASTLHTHPEKNHTAIGEIIANAKTGADPIYASYHAVFALWMLTFATKESVVHLILEKVCSSRLAVVLARLLRHASGQRLKIARVTLATLRNMCSGNHELHTRIRRDLISADVPAVLQRLMQMTSGAGSLIGKDEDAMQDANALLALLQTEHQSMSTIDAYISEVRAGSLHWSTIHTDAVFWNRNAQKILEAHRDVISLLSDVIKNKNATPEEREVACNDLIMFMRESVSGRLAVSKEEGLKENLMVLMASEEADAGVRMAALSCVQIIMLQGR